MGDSGLLQKAWNALNNNALSEASRYIHECLNLQPGNPEALHLAGIIAFQQHAIPEALRFLEKASAAAPENPQILYNYGTVLFESGEYSVSLRIFRKVLDSIPDHIPSLNKCCVICGITGNVTVAEKICRQTIALDPSNFEAYNNLGNILKEQGKIDEALQAYDRSLSCKPDYGIAASNRLLCLNYSTKSQSFIFAEHTKWEQRIASTIKSTLPNIKAPLRPKKDTLRVGYVSPDFRIHSVAYFIEPVLKNHDRAKYEVYCYAHVPLPDAMTDRLQGCAHGWRWIHTLDDRKILEQIRHDAIDILIDLAGHSGESRLTLFACKPAPLQITYLGYPNTTGVSAMDFRITDSLADPQDQDCFYTEKLYRMPDCFLCYKPSEPLPPLAEPPVLKKGYITFGSFNNLPKVNHNTVTVWAKLLRAVPNAHLMIKTKSFNDPGCTQYHKNLFTQQGIDNARLDFFGHIPSMEGHLSHYNAVDIALDTFPYNGTTTTCEALSMGIPVITLAGLLHAGRVGMSLLTAIGLQSFISADEKHYVMKAAELASDISMLCELRKNLRNQLLHSPLCDAPAFTRQFEDALLDMWGSK